MSEKHTLSVLVENKPGVLTRVSALFTRRGFNIHSLAVGPTEHEDISRITVIADAEGLAMEQVTKQLNKLVNVLKIVELTPTPRSSASSTSSRCTPMTPTARRCSRSSTCSAPTSWTSPPRRWSLRPSAQNPRSRLY